MRLEPDLNTGEDLKALLEENLRYAKAIYTSTEKVRRYMFWGRVYDVFKLLLIVVPLVIGFWYLQPLLQGALSSYQQLLGDSPSTSGTSINASTLQQLRELQKSGQLNLQDLLK